MKGSSGDKGIKCQSRQAVQQPVFDLPTQKFFLVEELTRQRSHTLFSQTHTTMVKNKKNSSKQHDSPALQDFLGFKVLPVLVDDNCRHYIYMRKHESRNSFHLAADRTLFVVNLPVDATEASLQDLFSPYGTVVYVQFPGDPAYEPPVKPKTKAERMKLKQQQLDKEAAEKDKWRHLLHTGASAHIVFQHEDQVNKVLEMPMDDVKRWKTGKSSNQPLGYRRKSRLVMETQAC